MKLGIIGSGNIVSEFLSFIDEIKSIELVAIYGRKHSIDKLHQLQNKNNIKKYIRNLINYYWTKKLIHFMLPYPTTYTLNLQKRDY